MVGRETAVKRWGLRVPGGRHPVRDSEPGVADKFAIICTLKSPQL